MDKLLIKECIFHGSWLVVPVSLWLTWRLRKAQSRWLAACLLTGALLFAWARFVEPQMIRVRQTTLPGTGGQARIVLISDVHLGVYKDARFLARVVDRINAVPSVDAVVIAGDLTYEPQGEDLQALFAPLARLQAPTYAVLGNHDQQRPGPDIDVELRQALARNDVEVIEGRAAQVGPFRLAGLGDRWAGRDDVAFLRPPVSRPTLVLAHNPDSAIQLSPADAVVVLAGHTHGGQIRLPWVYRRAIPTRYGFDRGEQWLRTPQGKVRVFTTAGVGEVGLPLRLFNPPSIDVLDLRP